jgi:DNA-directed RNA polymerase specialized sigma24 family protein
MGSDRRPLLGGGWKMSYVLVRDEQAAAAVQQETFIKAFQNLIQFRGSSTLEAWLKSICRNCCRDEWRRQKRQAKDLSLDSVLKRHGAESRGGLAVNS